MQKLFKLIIQPMDQAPAFLIIPCSFIKIKVYVTQVHLYKLIRQQEQYKLLVNLHLIANILFK